MNIYQRAKKNGAEFIATCVSISKSEWDQLMKGARRANRKEVVKIALQAGAINEWQAKKELKNPWFNPYHHFRTETHIIYTHSGIEHFILVN